MVPDAQDVGESLVMRRGLMGLLRGNPLADAFVALSRKVTLTEETS